MTEWANLTAEEAAIADVLLHHMQDVHGFCIDELAGDTGRLVRRESYFEDIDRIIVQHEALHPEDERAYDGEALPQRRELTAREREILVRTLHTVLYVIRKVGHTNVEAVAQVGHEVEVKRVTVPADHDEPERRVTVCGRCRVRVGKREGVWKHVESEARTPMRVEGQADYDVLVECLNVLNPRRD